MKVISFSAVEVLPSLLNKTKEQTIRPLFCIPCSRGAMKHFDHIANKKEPRLQVGDRVQLVWKRFSPKDAWFCSVCGNEADDEGFPPVGISTDVPYTEGECRVISCRACIKKGLGHQKATLLSLRLGAPQFFPKILGTAEITEVFVVTLNNVDGSGYVSVWREKEGTLFNEGYPLMAIQAEFEEFVKRDGFNNEEEFHKWFSSHYNLSVPRKFVCYRRKNL